MRWLVFGNWPSENDLDLVLEGGDAAALVAAVPRRVRDPLSLVTPLTGLPMPPGLWAGAIRAAGGLPLDTCLVARPGDWSLCAVVEPPYTAARARWVLIHQDYFTKARPLRVPPPALGRMLARQLVAASPGYRGTGRSR